MRSTILPAVLALLLAMSAGEAAAQTATSAATRRPPSSQPPPADAVGYRVGQAQVIPLLDGILHNDFATIVTKANRPRLQRVMARDGQGTVRDVSTNAYLIRLEGRLLLVDTGAGTLFGPSLGKVGPSLDAAGVQLAEISDVFITHLHPDHFGGLLGRDGAPAFPNATVHLARAEAAYWLSPVKAARVAEPQRDWFDQAQRALKPYADRGRVKLFDGPTVFFPSFRARPAPGHTPGHTVYMLTSDGQTLAFWGDLVNAGFQFDDPELPLVYDTNAPRAAAERRHSLAGAARQGEVIALAHETFPGLGRIARAAGAYRWVPVHGVTDASAK